MGETKQREQAPEPGPVAAGLRSDAAALRPQLQPPPFQAGPPAQRDRNSVANAGRSASSLIGETANGLRIALPMTPSDFKNIAARAKERFADVPEAMAVVANLAKHTRDAEAAAREGRVDNAAMAKAQLNATSIEAVLHTVDRTQAAEQQGDSNAGLMKTNMVNSFRLIATETPEAVERVVAAAKMASDYLSNGSIYRHSGNETALTRLLSTHARFTNPEVTLTHAEIQRDVFTVGQDFQAAVVQALGPAGGARRAAHSESQFCPRPRIEENISSGLQLEGLENGWGAPGVSGASSAGPASPPAGFPRKARDAFFTMAYIRNQGK